MKIVNEQFVCQIELVENTAMVLVIENPGLFTKTVSELREQLSDNNFGWILSENGEELSFSKYVEIIVDPFATELNQKRILTKLYSVIDRNVMESELLNQWKNLYAEMLNMTINIMDDMPYALECNKEGNVTDFLKGMEVKFDSHPENLLEKLIDYICVINNVFGKKIFILINIKSYLTKEEIVMLYKKMFYEKIFIVLIENAYNNDNIDVERIIIIDKDICVIRKSSEDIP